MLTVSVPYTSPVVRICAVVAGSPTSASVGVCGSFNDVKLRFPAYKTATCILILEDVKDENSPTAR